MLLCALSPLMRNAAAGLIEQAAILLLQQAPQPQQADLLSILGVFAERIMTIERFAQFVGKERLMESRLLDYLVAEKTAAIRDESRAEGRAEGRVEGQAEGRVEGECQQAREYILDTLVTRLSPAVQDYRRVGRALQAIADLPRLNEILRHALLAADFDAFERAAFPPPATQ
jgi:predicted transposase YdaD